MENYELEINNENIKDTLINDYLGNKEKLYSLSNLIDCINNNITICIDGDWGCGKTIFIKQFLYLLKNQEEYNQLYIKKDIQEVLKNVSENNICVYYDAWKNDNHIDAFESIIFNILNEFPNYKDQVSEFLNIKDTLIDFGQKFINKFTNGYINLEKVKTYQELADQIETVEEKKEQFRKLLENILNEKRMILIIDELDRCNPIFASKVLETIKHFYDIKNITIIVSANNRELSNTIKKQYGQDFDGYGYLNRFYDFIITLDNSKNIEYSQRVIGLGTSTYLPHNIACEMFKKYNFSYRDCNRYGTMYNMVKKYIESDDFFANKKQYNVTFSIILPIIIAFKIKDIEAYQSVLNDEEKYLRESLEYINSEFKKSDGIYSEWLADMVGTEKGNEIDLILKLFSEFKKSEIYSKTINNCIKMIV